jgi:hypothetical protein
LVATVTHMRRNTTEDEKARNRAVVQQLRAKAAAHAGQAAQIEALALEAHATGSTWGELGEILGVSKQSAWEKFGKPHLRKE